MLRAVRVPCQPYQRGRGARGGGGKAYKRDGQVDPLAVDDAVRQAAHGRHQPGVFLADLGEELGLREGAAVVLGLAGAAGAGEARAVGRGVEALGLGEDAGAGGFGGFGGGRFGGGEAAGEGGEGGGGGAPEGAGLREEEPREGERGRHGGGGGVGRGLMGREWEGRE